MLDQLPRMYPQQPQPSSMQLTPEEVQAWEVIREERAALVALEDMALNGDGGFWCGKVITPIFLLLAYEVSKLTVCPMNFKMHARSSAYILILPDWYRWFR